MQAKPKIAFVFQNSPNSRDFDRFFINNFKENGFSTLILDISDILKQPCINPDFTVSQMVIKCKNILEIYIELLKFKPKYVFIFIKKIMFRCYFKRLFIVNITNTIFQTIEYCGPNGPFHASSKKKFNPLRRLLKKIFFEHFYISAKYSIVCGSESLKNASGSPIFSHTADYNLYLKSLNKDTIAKNINYLLFLDEDYVFHQDYAIIGMKPPVMVENYYSEVNYMLKKLGEMYELQPIIQVHPTADRKLAKKYYDFPLSDDKTIDAVKGSKLVVSHDSTALQMAVICKKPVVLLETTEIIASEYYHPQIQRFAKALGCSVLTIEDFNRDIQFPVICEESYAQYMEKYVKLDLSDQRFSCDILSSFIMNNPAKKRKNIFEN